MRGEHTALPIRSRPALLDRADAQVPSHGEIQAWLSILVVAREHRRIGVARRLVREAMTRSNGLRLDAISCADPFYEALGFGSVSGFRAALDPARST